MWFALMDSSQVLLAFGMSLWSRRRWAKYSDMAGMGVSISTTVWIYVECHFASTNKCLEARLVCYLFLKNNFSRLAIPIVEANTWITHMEYSPVIGGFAVVLNDGRAAFLTASSLRFDPNVRITLSGN